EHRFASRPQIAPSSRRGWTLRACRTNDAPSEFEGGVISVEDWAEIRQLHLGDGMPIKAIARRMKVERVHAEKVWRQLQRESVQVVRDRTARLMVWSSAAPSAWRWPGQRPRWAPAATPAMSRARPTRPREYQLTESPSSQGGSVHQ